MSETAFEEIQFMISKLASHNSGSYANFFSLPGA